jgi:hypothetical protein
MNIKDCDYKSGTLVIPTDAACSLYVFCARFRLPEHDHQTESRNVEPHRDHVRRDSDIDVFLRIECLRQAALRFRDLVGRHAARKLYNFISNLPIRELSVRLPHSPSTTVGRNAIPNFIFNEAPRAAEFAQTVKISQQRHVGVGGILGISLLGVFQICLLRRSQQDQIHPQHRHLWASALSGDSDVSSRIAFVSGVDLSKKGIAPVRPRRGKDVNKPVIEERTDLILCATNCRR